jgi:hypothetical protein
MDIRKIAYALILFGALGGIAAAQKVSITVKLINGKTGRVLANQHMLLGSFTSGTGWQEPYDGKTDKDGLVTFSVDLQRDKLLTVDVDDFMTACEEKGHACEIPLADILSTGVIMPGLWNHRVSPEKDVPGRIVVYVRKVTFWDKMKI